MQVHRKRGVFVDFNVLTTLRQSGGRRYPEFRNPSGGGRFAKLACFGLLPGGARETTVEDAIQPCAGPGSKQLSRSLSR